MSSKEKPTLGGTRIKTRKRNISVPLNPTSFVDALIQTYKENQGDLDLVARSLEASDLDFSRYGDSFFEVLFTGGRIQSGSAKQDELSESFVWSILSLPPTRDSILPYVIFIQKILRRRPFLIKSLENVMRRLIQSLELYTLEERQKFAISTALCFSQRFTGLSPDFVCTALLNDTLVNKGTSLFFLTEFIKVFLQETSFDELVSLLKRGKVDDRLIEFFPAQKRTIEAFSQHFSSSGLSSLIDYNQKVVFDVKLKELDASVSDMISEGVEVKEVIDFVTLKRKEASLPESDVLKAMWDCVMGSIQWSGKNQQQNINSALRQVKTWGKLFGAFCKTSKLELELIYKIQMQCYEDTKVQKLFPEFIRTLYDLEVLAEDTILLWFRKGTNPKGRQLFQKSLEPFVKWLEEAEEED